MEVEEIFVVFQMNSVRSFSWGHENDIIIKVDKLGGIAPDVV